MCRKSREGFVHRTLQTIARAFPVLAVALLALAAIQPALAHIDPAGSSANGITPSITAYRFDQVTPVITDAGGFVTECEQIWYRVTLSKANAPNGAFEGGTWTLTTPDGVVHPLGAVPCIGGTTNDPNAPGGRGQCAGSPTSITSAFIPYTVRGDLDPSGPDGLVATTSLANFFAHISTNDTGGNFTGLGLPLTKQDCENDLFCAPNHCDPDAVFGDFDERRGTCVDDTPPDCTDADNDLCTPGSCDEDANACANGTRTTCGGENSFCAPNHCDAATGNCVNDPVPDCTNPDNDLCTPGFCDPDANKGTGACANGTRTTCGGEDSFCAPNHCDAATGDCVNDTPPDCTDSDNDLCTTGTCDEDANACANGPRTICDDDLCQVCAATSGNCVNRDPLPAACTPSGLCRVTGGGIVCQGVGQCCDEFGTCTANTGSGGGSVDCTSDSDCSAFPDTTCHFCTVDPTTGADIEKATFGGQVGAPFVTPGCHDNADCVQGNWTHQRHKKHGSLHGPDFYSMTCTCDVGDGTQSPGVCNPGDRPNGPEPSAAPANIACFTGTGLWNPTSGRRTIPVAFRVEVEDRGEPGGGNNAGSLDDVYRIRIWFGSSAADAAAKAEAACCANDIASVNANIGFPNVLDGGNLIHGNLQIHKLTGNPNNTSFPPGCFVGGEPE